MKYTFVYRKDLKNEVGKHLILEIVFGDNVDLEVPEGYLKMTMETDSMLLPVKQAYEKLGVDYIVERQFIEEPLAPIIEKDYSKK
jgi:hypothetical protein